MTVPGDSAPPIADAAPKATLGAVNRSMAKGAAWTIAMRLVIRLVGITSMIILARILVPADFGLVAMATMVFGFIQVMGDFGFDVILIQKQDAGRDYYDTAWTLRIIRGFLIALILFAGAGAAAEFFGDPRLVNIIHALCIVAIVRGFSNIGMVDFRKHMNFAKDFQYMVGGKLCAFIATISFAFILQSYWALVIGITAGACARLVMGYWMHPFRPRLSLARWREIMKFSKWLLFNNMLGFINYRADTLIVGKILGAATLGVYTLAYEIATMASSELVAPIRRALLPGYSKLAHDPEALRRSFIDGFALIIMIAAPVAVGIGLVADPMVRLLLGDKWLDAIPLLQVLSIFGLIQVASGNAGPVLLALGKPNLMMMISACSVGIRIPLLLYGTLEWGVTGAIWSLVATNIFSTALGLTIVLRLISARPVHLITSIWRVFVALISMWIAVWLVGDIYGNSQMLPLNLGTKSVAGALAYIAVTMGLWRLCGSPDGPERQLLRVVAPKLGRIGKVLA